MARSYIRYSFCYNSSSISKNELAKSVFIEGSRTFTITMVVSYILTLALASTPILVLIIEPVFIVKPISAIRPALNNKLFKQFMKTHLKTLKKPALS